MATSSASERPSAATLVPEPAPGAGSPPASVPSGAADDAAARLRRRARILDTIERVSLVLIGLTSVVLAVIVLSHPAVSATTLLALLAAAIALNSVRTILAGGRLFRPTGGAWSPPRFGWKAMRQLGILGIGVVAIAICLIAAIDPSLALAAVVFLLAAALVAQGLGRIAEGFVSGHADWLRTSGIATGGLIVLLVVASVAFEGFALFGFAILVGVVILISGVETIVFGLRPTDPRQFVILKLVLFAAFYGLVMINWIDLFGKSVPGYGVWLVMSYMAPFGVILVFQGWEAWPLATSLGLLVSLMNDVGYFFVGNLLFGFHENLGPWIEGQLGFEGTKLVTIFEAGAFNIDVDSWMMGLSIYLRAAVVGVILYYWWRNPGRLVARSAEGSPSAAP